MHTPGPWEASKMTKRWRISAAGRLGGVGAISRMRVKWNIADVIGTTPEDDDNALEANARLISAAPRMYDYISKRAEDDAEAAQILRDINGGT